MTDAQDRPRRAWYDRALDGVIGLCAILATVGLGSIVVMYCIEIFARYFLNAPTIWANDFIVFVLCISIFLMMPEITRSGGHVAVTLLIDNLPRRAQPTARRIIAVVGAAVCLAAAYISLDSNVTQYTQDLRTVTTIAAPKWAITAFITFGLALSALAFLRQALAGEPPANAATIG